MITAKIGLVAMLAMLSACNNHRIPARASPVAARGPVVDVPPMDDSGFQFTVYDWYEHDDTLYYPGVTDEVFYVGDHPIVLIDEPEPRDAMLLLGHYEADHEEIVEVYTPPPAPSCFIVGNPYLIDGVPYYPHEDWEYNRIGIAALYGVEFQGGQTSSGEPFDTNLFTAAHRTLPMPSFVRVTNLENNRAVSVRINDRGPFVRDRSIKLSSAAADAIGMREAGTARVRVQILVPESRHLRDLAMDCLPTEGVFGPDIYAPAPIAPAEPPRTLLIGGVPDDPEDFMGEEEVATTRPEPEPAPAPAPVVRTRNFYVQVASFNNFEQAERLKNRVVAHGDASVFRINQDGRQTFRVRLGGFETEAEAISARNSLDRAGITGSRVVLNDNGVLRWR